MGVGKKTNKKQQDVELEVVTSHDPDAEYDDDGVEHGLERHDTHHSRPRLPHLFSSHGKHDRPHWRKALWEDIRVGDFIKVMDNEPIPADMLICATSEDENVAFVETKNLDGETNLKSRNAAPALTHLNSAAACADKSNVFRIGCEAPDTNMYKLNAAIEMGDQTSSVDLQMTLLRGTFLRNTKWVIGVVLYTGQDSKIVMNSGGTPSKRGRVERQMNPQVYVPLFRLDFSFYIQLTTTVDSLI
jgi:phospholipid-translocating ATPase